MKSLKAFLFTFLLSYVFWILFLMQDINITDIGWQELLAGAIVAVIVALVSKSYFVREDGTWIFKEWRIFYLISFIPLYLLELIRANWDVAKKAFSWKIKIDPAIVKIETELKSDWGLAMLSNCITLTPGTITMDIYEDDNKDYLYIHWLNAEDEKIEKASDKIKGTFEPYVRKVFK